MADKNLTVEVVKGILEDLLANKLPETVKAQFEPLKKEMEEFLKKGGQMTPPLNLGAAADAGTPDATGKEIATPFKGKFALGEQAIAVQKHAVHHVDDARLKEIIAKAPAGAAEGVGADGGFLVQQDVAADIYRRIYETGVLLKNTGIRRIPISANSNGLDIPGVDETSRADGSRWGGVQIYRAGEAVAGTPKRPKYRMIQLRLKKMLGFSYVTDELLQDSAALSTLLQEAFAEEFGYKMDSEIAFGTGADGMLGFMNSPSLLTVAKESGQKAATVVTENLLNMWASMWHRSWGNATWYISQSLIPQLGQLNLKVGTGGVPVYLPFGTGGIANPLGATLLGRPVQILEQAKVLGTVGDIMLADLSQYVMIEKGGIRGDISMHLKFDTAEMAFRWILRNDGQPLWHKTLTLADGSTTVSPFVALATRA